MTILERRHKGSHISWLIGIDEVGRGPLAGPVSVCLCLIPFVSTKQKSYSVFLSQYKKEIKKLRVKNLRGKDSKKLKEHDRVEWKNFLQKTHAVFVYGSMSAKNIDTKGIAVCIRALIKKNLNFLRGRNIQESEVRVLLDGGLKAPKEYLHQETIIKGDEKEMVISFASIVAKVTRDQYMKKVSKKYKEYGFDVHKGYGTLKHRRAISKFGMLSLHRKSFCTRV